jgi:6,7-dimethyl-8-ribityllumazine synthase
MATTDLSAYDKATIPNAEGYRFGIVVSEWNYGITDNLFKAAYQTFLDHGVSKENIFVAKVPGSFELIYGCKHMIKNNNLNAMIAIGSVIKGETRHFDFVCEAVAHGIKDINMRYDVPTIFCVLTDDHKQQAIDRSGGKHGNKGIESAIAAIKMANLNKH